ncbi:MAG: hypothetical protein K2O44_05610 [Clostridia bacterium]|nr:hypothetical protein [Clostridia bacterium]
MADFLKVTNKYTNLSRLIAVDRIVSIIEEPDGTAFVEFYPPKRNKLSGLCCSEKFSDLNELFSIFGTVRGKA